ncbi:mRNA 3'-end processing factor [Vulcanisaeta souniana JCM 11219]|uniref:Transcription termination factor FttA n=2 Tax=Vulcanisaeta souniana TaxID=164452 RepID=A0A830E831_9CREN|nr:mRNA 3'-end processing factor [Vulcanisaeta souniana JCM 11219]GGI80687.1 mRNA 3'-end processing factor [Vulcanisaeta souniana JCM 11219]
MEKKIMEILPSEAKFSRVEFEGPNVIIYVMNPRYVMEHSEYIKTLAKELKKYIIIRGDPKVRIREVDKLKKTIIDMVTKSVGSNVIDDIVVDEPTGEVYVYLKKPVRERSKLEKEILAETGWKPWIIATALEMGAGLPRSDIDAVKQIQLATAKDRLEFLKRLGMRIHREPIYRDARITVTGLGAQMEVGRSAILVRTKESSILLDCGVKPSSSGDEAPLIDDLDLDTLDAVVITHAHMDHIGYVPYLFKYGYKGPVYMTEPTKYLMEVLLTDYIEQAESEGRVPPYSRQDLAQALYHTITLNYADHPTDISPDTKLMLFDAGHEVGSSVVHLHIGNGLYNIIYTGDMKYGPTRLLNPAHNKFKRAELLIMESTYGGKEDIQTPRQESEQKLVELVGHTVEHDGKVLIPVFSTGRAQEILLVLNEAINNKQLPKVPIYVDGMVLETLNVHLMFPDYLNRTLRELIYDGVNPFLSEYVKPIERARDPEKRKEQVMEILQGPPAVILAPHGMLNGGPIMDYFVHAAEDERNLLLFVSYQAENTIGRKIQQGERKLTVRYYSDKVTLDVKMKVDSIPGFSGHSDRRQLLNYVRNMEPKPHRVMLVHGEPSKIMNLALTLELQLKIPTIFMNNGETVRLI